jgi:hypothetical protein
MLKDFRKGLKDHLEYLSSNVSFFDKAEYICRRLIEMFKYKILVSITGFFQRLDRGFSARDIWSLNKNMAKWIIPRLKYLRRHTRSYPMDFEDNDYQDGFVEWQKAIDKMIRAFEIAIKGFGSDMPGVFVEDFTPPYSCKINEALLTSLHLEYDLGIELFKKYFPNLGW